MLVPGPPSPVSAPRPTAPQSFPAAMGRIGAVLLASWAVVAYAGPQTNCESDCSGHGDCNLATAQCTCYEEWGAATDIAVYKAPDCSKRVCPSGKAWADVPTSSTAAHALAECSNAGTCDRATGQCICFPSFAGEACQRTSCPKDCSGHGKCVSMRVMATMDEAQPIGASTTYEGDDAGSTWDQDIIFGCVCDSSWAVGLAGNETQTPEYFGPDCSLKRCPSGDDPMTTADETDCEGVNGGAAGNLCHVDCSNRGLCNYEAGLCECFDGFTSSNCGAQDALAVSS